MAMHIARYVLLVALCMPVSVAAQQFELTPQPVEPAGKGIIRGVVTAVDTGKPIRNASILIQGSDSPPVVPTRSVSTDAQGRYEISGLRGGQYRLSARKPGYVSRSNGQDRENDSARTVTLLESTPLEEIDFALSPGGVIVARITDQFGDPVRGVTVRPRLQRFMEGRRQLSGVALGAGGSITDDRGETRMYGLGPGDYYLVAMPDFQTTWRGELETLFPGTLDIANAQTVRVGIGQEAFATFPILHAPLSKLSGRIIGSDGVPLVTTNVSVQKLSVLGGGSSQRINIEPDGSFRLENLAPGNWMIVVREPEYGSASVRLLGDDVQGLTVNTRKAAAVRGRVTFEGSPPSTNPLLLDVVFDGPRTIEGGAGFIQRGSIYVTPETQWTFETQVSGVGVIRPRACCVPDDNGVDRASPWILKAVLLDGKDVTDMLLDFGTTYAGNPVEVVLTQRKGELNGVVQDDRGRLTADYRIVLFPEDEQQWTPFSRFIFLGRPDQQGRFTIGNLPSARYLAAAVESLDPGEERNPEMLSRLRGVATRFDLSDGQTRSITLKLTR